MYNQSKVVFITNVITNVDIPTSLVWWEGSEGILGKKTTTSLHTDVKMPIFYWDVNLKDSKYLDQHLMENKFEAVQSMVFVSKQSVGIFSSCHHSKFNWHTIYTNTD